MLCLFFHLHIVSKSPAEIYMPISVVLELRSLLNLPCVVKLAIMLINIIIHEKYYNISILCYGFIHLVEKNNKKLIF